MGLYSLRMIVVLAALTMVASACFDSGSSSDDPPDDSTTVTIAPITTSTAPLTTTTTDRAAGQPLVYSVQEGDTLGSIAQNFNTTVELLVEVNNIDDPNNLFVGQELIIPAPGTTASSTTSTVPGTPTTVGP